MISPKSLSTPCGINHHDEMGNPRSTLPQEANALFADDSRKRSTTLLLSLSQDDVVLSCWVSAFASSHIGMSACRSSIISLLGNLANNMNLVGNEKWKLPDWWPADESGNSFFPDQVTTGRQIYRAGYTTISFATLGSAFAAYLHSSSMAEQTTVSMDDSLFLSNSCIVAAATSLGASTASLFNASPLGLMPGFQEATAASSSRTSNPTIAGIRRDDTIKFTTRGLTRITRHPLILPVVPWGLATGYLAGGRGCDYILFAGLAVYAVAGCFAQDLRVQREEGSVGTAFQSPERLKDFFAKTSFVPFGAVLDGRQQIKDVVTEAPWLPFFVGSILGVPMEEKILQIIAGWSV